MTKLKRAVTLDEARRIVIWTPEKVEGGYARVFIDKEMTGAENFSLLLSELAPGKAHLREVHPVEHGFFILSGEGLISVGEDDWKVKPNTAIFVPKGVFHQVKNPGTEPLSYLVIFAPPVPK